jgi:hypothetical protein
METSAISPKGKNAASRFAAVIIGARPPTYTVAFHLAWSDILRSRNVFTAWGPVDSTIYDFRVASSRAWRVREAWGIEV